MSNSTDVNKALNQLLLDQYNGKITTEQMLLAAWHLGHGAGYELSCEQAEMLRNQEPVE